MLKRRVVLLRKLSLLAEGLEQLLRHMEDVELIGLWDLDPHQVTRLSEMAPDLVLVADEGTEAGEAASLASRILEQNPGLPVVCVGLRRDTLRLYTSHALPARVTELVELIRNLPFHPPEDVEPRA